jgi:thiopurine S-methyltransferase
MQHNYWLQRWIEKRIGFHRSDVNPLLQRFLPRPSTSTARVLVPLCGKSADLIWLATKGYDVTGIELSPLAAAAFASENNLEFKVAEVAPFQVLSAGRIHFYVGDFFAATAEQFGRFDLIYDRAALIALPPELRRGYAEKIQSLMAPEGQLLLISLEYDENAMAGPPFSVREKEVRALFHGCNIGLEFTCDALQEEPHFRERGLQWMNEVVYRISRQ